MPPNISSFSPLPPPAPKRSRWLLYGCGTLVALLLVVVGTVVITLWWMQRPIKPVVLSAPEKAAIEEKLRHQNPGEARPYLAGSKLLKLTEREINGLLNANTDLGKSVRLEFAQDAINAYLAVPIPEDFPIGGGKMFRARGRFRLSLSNKGSPYAILDDVTVFGVSLPKAWLGGLKGENLIGQAMGERDGAPIFRGIKSLHVEPGALVLEVED